MSTVFEMILLLMPLSVVLLLLGLAAWADWRLRQKKLRKSRVFMVDVKSR